MAFVDPSQRRAPPTRQANPVASEKPEEKKPPQYTGPPRPRARPLFPGGVIAGANAVRGYWPASCYGYRPGTGPIIPPHWFDGGLGWTTAHFFDLEPFDAIKKIPGRHQCKYCDYVAEGEECCGKGACWRPLARAPPKMAVHLTEVHKIEEPPKRQWATSCSDPQGCLDVLFCWPCQASRQINAAHGRPNQLNVFWCLFFALGTTVYTDEYSHGDGQITQFVFHCLAVYCTRSAIRELNRIDEGFCDAILMPLCCPCCSLAQTYREFTAAGVWPGGLCNGGAPPAIAMNNPPPGYVPLALPPVPHAQQSDGQGPGSTNDGGGITSLQEMMMSS